MQSKQFFLLTIFFAEFILEKSNYLLNIYSNKSNQMVSPFVLERRICMTKIFQDNIDFSFYPKIRTY